MKRLLFLIALMVVPATSWAVGRSVFPTKNLTTQYVVDASINPINEKIDLPSNGVNARVQLTTRDVNNCTFQAMAGNTLGVYIGGPTVTNSLGVNEGIKLGPGEAFGPISIVNSNLLFAATDTNGNDVKMFCN